MKETLIITLLLLTQLAGAHPVSFKNGVGIMSYNTQETNEVLLTYSPTSYFAIGTTYLRDSKSEFYIPRLNFLVKRWNNIDSQGNVVCQLAVNLPARGRTVLGSVAAHILDKVLPQMVRDCLVASSLNLKNMRSHVDSIEDQAWLQKQLDSAGLVSFVRNGAILPRVSGVDDHPMSNDNAIPFESPLSLETSFSLPNAGVAITGMGIPKGITLICGGGFHGKSTLLEALQLAVYYKIPGDGREFCVTSAMAAKIRAEDGRCINAVDISSFIKNLPFGKDTTCFTTADASGSTSQASNIVEVSGLRIYWEFDVEGGNIICCLGILPCPIQCVSPPRKIALDCGAVLDGSMRIFAFVAFNSFPFESVDGLGAC